MLDPAGAQASRDALSAIVVDCVAGGASVSFMEGFATADADAWWNDVIADLRAGRLALFGAWLGDELVGTVHLGFSAMPNGRHRGEVRKLLVHRRARGRGVASALMTALETEAKARGLRTLVLDTATGSPGEALYGRLGWTRVGVIPDYALWPDGRPCATTLFWKTP